MAGSPTKTTKPKQNKGFGYKRPAETDSNDTRAPKVRIIVKDVSNNSAKQGQSSTKKCGRPRGKEKTADEQDHSGRTRCSHQTIRSLA